jgi:hypothetical protein
MRFILKSLRGALRQQQSLMISIRIWCPCRASLGLVGDALVPFQNSSGQLHTLFDLKLLSIIYQIWVVERTHSLVPTLPSLVALLHYSMSSARLYRYNKGPHMSYLVESKRPSQVPRICFSSAAPNSRLLTPVSPLATGFSPHLSSTLVIKFKQVALYL